MVLSEALFSVFFNLSFFHAILSLVSFPASFTFLPSPQSCPTRPIKNQVFLPDGPPPLLLHEVSSPLSPTGINYDDLFMPSFPHFPPLSLFPCCGKKHKPGAEDGAWIKAKGKGDRAAFSKRGEEGNMVEEGGKKKNLGTSSNMAVEEEEGKGEGRAVTKPRRKRREGKKKWRGKQRRRSWGREGRGMDCLLLFSLLLSLTRLAPICSCRRQERG